MVMMTMLTMKIMVTMMTMMAMKIMVTMMTMVTSGERNVTIEARLAIRPKRPRLVKSTPRTTTILSNKQCSDQCETVDYLY